jgi:predicted DNA-binding protein YlxM (UPF0122 family)
LFREGKFLYFKKATSHSPIDKEEILDYHDKKSLKGRYWDMAKRWTPEEERFLFTNYETRSLEEWAKRYGTTKKAISNKMSKLRKIFAKEEEITREDEEHELEVPEVEKKLAPKQWTPQEEEFLFNNYKKYSVEEWARRFGVTKKAIINKMSSLRSKFPRKEIQETVEKVEKREVIERPKKYKLVPSPYEIKTPDGWQRIMMRVVDEEG